MGIRDLLGRRDFRHLLVGQAVSSLGDWMGTLALLYLVLELSGSTTAVGGVLVLRLLPSALGAPFAARVVTGWPRRNVMMTADLIRAGMAFALPVLPHLWWVYLWAFAIEVVGLTFLPARDAALPLLIEDREGGHDPRTLELANGITLGTQYGMIPLGAGLLGLLTWLAGSLGVAGHWVYVLVFWLDALSYLVSYLAIRSIPDLGPRHGDENGEGGMGGAERAGAADGAARERRPVPERRPARERRRGERWHPHRARPSQGFLAALRIPVVRGILPGVAVVALGLGALFSVGVLFVRNVLRAGPFGFGLLVTMFGVGAVLGLLILRRHWTGTLPTQIRVAIATQGLVIAAMGAIGSEILAFLGAVLFGAAATSALVGTLTYLQEGLGGYARNLALTAFHASLRAGLALAALLAGVAADVLRRHDVILLGFDPVQTVLIGSGLIVFSGVFLLHTPGDGRPSGRPSENPDDPPGEWHGPEGDKRSLLEEDPERRSRDPARWALLPVPAARPGRPLPCLGGQVP
ncbi:MFS transporter [Actinomadura sp. SCN-SB]|uniref:MFS transporter n=1 Tax=Actinomadura sp. SCN-SB TaxID=3373092 RepID=UPI00375338A5